MATILQSDFHWMQEVMIMIKERLTRRERVLLFVLAAVLLIYLYLNFLIFPAYARISDLKTELMIKKRAAADKDEAQRLMYYLDGRLTENKANLDKIEKAMPYNIRLPELVVNIDGKIAALDMEIQSIYVGEPDTANKDYDIVPIKVSFKGEYDNIINFINYIENNERKYIIDSFSLSPHKRNEAIPFNIEIRTFVLKYPRGTVIPEPVDYDFFRHNNGKSYPFIENKAYPGIQKNTAEDYIMDMKKKYDKLDDIIDKSGIIFRKND